MASPARRHTPPSLDIKSLQAEIAKEVDHPSQLHAAARWYAQHGFAILPFVVTKTGKPGFAKSDGKNSKGRFLAPKDASMDLGQIDRWWHPTKGECPGASIAMACGGQSGVVAVDLDVKEAIDGISTLVDLSAAYGDYSDVEATAFDTVMATTPSGGRHLLYRYHPEILTNAQAHYPGIDTRGGLKRDPGTNGGVIFVEPSIKPEAIGGDGKTCYRWDNSGSSSIIDMPQWLVDTLCGRPPERARMGVRLQESYTQSAPGDHGDGRDRNIYCDLLRFVGVGYTEAQLWALAPQILERMDPPDSDMVDAKIRSAIDSDAFRVAQTETDRKEKTDGLKLDKDDKGRILKTSKNLNTVLTSAMFEHDYGDIRYDDFYQNFTRNGIPLAMVADYAIGIQLWLSANLRMECGADGIRAAVEYAAFVGKPHINVARDYMLGCPVPEQPKDLDFLGSGRAAPGKAFKRLCTEVLDLNNTKLHKGYDSKTRDSYMAFLWVWMQGVVSRACQPGCKMEMMLNMFGAQGIGKSTFFRALLPDAAWFGDGLQDTIVMGGRDNKDELSKLMSKLIIEMPELSPIKRGGKSADDKIKQFISAQIDEFRRPYGHDVVKHPRTAALCGSSNNSDIYRDMTGDRRFLSINHGSVSIRLGDVDTGVMDEIRDALWGEVVHSFRPGELTGDSKTQVFVCVPKPLRKEQNRINGGHRYDEIGLDEVLEWMADKTRMTWDEILTQAKTVPGLRDTKEQTLLAMIRQELHNGSQYTFKRGGTRKNAAGNKERKHYWVNLEHPQEKGQRAGVEVPDHWSVNGDKSSEKDIETY